MITGPVHSGSTLLLLADGRLPSGGHAHSGGLEEAAAAGRVRDAATLSAWLTGRLATAGRVDAGLAAATRRLVGDARRLVDAGQVGRAVARLDAEAAARCPSPALRRASRAQGRGLIRAGTRMWPDPLLDHLAGGGVSPDGDAPANESRAPMWPVALGVVATAAAVGVQEAALVAAQSSVSGPAWAATRLLGLDPFAVARCLADLALSVDDIAEQAAAAASGASCEPATLDAQGAPLCEIGAELHAAWEVRLFAS